MNPHDEFVREDHKHTMYKRIAATVATIGAFGAVALVPSASTAQTITICPPGVTAPSAYCTTITPSAQSKAVAAAITKLAKALQKSGYDVFYSKKGQVTTIAFPAGGTVTIDYTIRYNASTGKASASKLKTVKIATGKKSKSSAGNAKVTVKATKTGAKILKKLKKQKKKVAITVKTTFNPTAKGVKSTVKSKKYKKVKP